MAPKTCRSTGPCSSAGFQGGCQELGHTEGKALSPEWGLGTAGAWCRAQFHTYWLALELFTLKFCMLQASCRQRESASEATEHPGSIKPQHYSVLLERAIG